MKKTFPLFAAIALLLAGSVAGAEKAQSVPVSDKIVKLEVQAPDGHWIKGMVREGDQFRIHDSALNLTMAMVPIITERGIRIRTFRVDFKPACCAAWSQAYQTVCAVMCPVVPRDPVCGNSQSLDLRERQYSRSVSNNVGHRGTSRSLPPLPLRM